MPTAKAPVLSATLPSTQKSPLRSPRRAGPLSITQPLKPVQSKSPPRQPRQVALSSGALSIKAATVSPKQKPESSPSLSSPVIAAPPPSGPKTYKYSVLKGNNSGLVRDALQRRPWWTPTVEGDTQFNFKWKQTVQDLHYNSLNRDPAIHQLVNHLECNREITTKPGLLRNLMAHMEKKDLNVFDVVPVTFFLKPHGPSHENELADFTNYFNGLATKASPSPVKKPVGIRASISMPPSKVASGSTTKAGPASPVKSTMVSAASTAQATSQAVARRRKPTSRVLAAKHCENNVWILKPSGMNRGRGIELFSNLRQLNAYLEEKSEVGSHSWVIQKYLERPLLIHERKFDIRVYCLVNYPYDVYFYKEGYLRTSSSKFSLANISDHSIHLTNNAVQKDLENYGKFEEGNQLDFKQFQQYIDEAYPEANVNFQRDIIPVMKDYILQSQLAVRKSINPHDRKRCFELFGYDFMLDEDFKLWLIEVNTNPCLSLSSGILRRLIPNMIEELVCLTVDEMFPPPNAADRPPVSGMFELLHSEHSEKAVVEAAHM